MSVLVASNVCGGRRDVCFFLPPFFTSFYRDTFFFSFFLINKFGGFFWGWIRTVRFGDCTLRIDAVFYFRTGTFKSESTIKEERRRIVTFRSVQFVQIFRRGTFRSVQICSGSFRSFGEVRSDPFKSVQVRSDLSERCVQIRSNPFG